MDRVISFPHLGNYYIVFDYFIRKATKCKVIVPPATTKRTIEIGSKYAPSFVCVPFKYNLGNYIEALEKGANTLVQGGGGCRYGYYGELEEKILRDLGYDFEFYNMIRDNHISLKKGYKFCKKMNKRANPISTFYYLINSLVMIICMDKIEKYIRLNMGFEVVDGSFEKIEKEYLDSFKDNGIFKNIYNYFKYRKKFRNILINKPTKPLRVAILGELYSLIDANTTYNSERKIMKMGVEVYRDTDLTYLLITKRFILNRMIRNGKKYLKYHLGADGTASIVRSINSNYMDGILHLKSFGCTPEISAMSILPKIANEYKIPILYFSFDSEDNEVGVDTRLEAFYDMIKRRNNG
mgnify:FL=1